MHLVSTEEDLRVNQPFTIHGVRHSELLYRKSFWRKSRPQGTSEDKQDASAAATAIAICILIAEDDDFSTILLKKNFKGYNITILCAENGGKQLKSFSIIRINLVLMDIKMPVMNGFEATKLIKKQRPDLSIIAQSAFTSKEDKEKAKEAGCDSFITKPINKSDLLELIQRRLHW